MLGNDLVVLALLVDRLDAGAYRRTRHRADGAAHDSSDGPGDDSADDSPADPTCDEPLDLLIVGALDGLAAAPSPCSRPGSVTMATACRL